MQLFPLVDEPDSTPLRWWHRPKARWAPGLPAPFLTWLLEFPFILVLAAVPWLVGALSVGDAMGLPLLFRSDIWWRQVVTGVTLGLYLAHVAYVGWILAQPGSRVGADDLYTRQAYPVRVLGPLGGLYWLGFLVADWNPRTLWLLGGLTFATALCLAVWSFEVLAKYERSAAGKLRQGANFLGKRIDQQPRLSRPRAIVDTVAQVLGRPPQAAAEPSGGDNGDSIHDAAALHLIGFAVIWLIFNLAAGWLPAAASLCILLAIVAAVWGYMRFSIPRRHLVYIGLLVVFPIIHCAFLEERHSLDALEGVQPVALARVYPQGAAPRPADLLDDQDALDAWREVAGPKPRLVVVATSGGGIRAAAWTVHVLSRIDAELPDFGQRVRIVTGASGGMVGATYWVASRPPTVPPCDPNAKLLDGMTADSLDAIANHFALIRPIDRGRELERSWEGHTGGCMAVTFDELRLHEALGIRPSLIFSPATVEDGRRVLASHLDLDHLTQTEHERAQRSRSAYELLRLFPDESFKVSELARLSATFPYISPEVRIPTKPGLRLVDAGFYDNFGVNLSARWIQEHADWLETETSGVVLIEVRDGPTHRDRLPHESPDWFGRGLSPIVAPIQTLYTSHFASAEFRNDEQIAALEERFGDQEGFFENIVLELPGEVPLTWRLSAEEVARVEAGMPESNDGSLYCSPGAAEATCDANLAELHRLIDWWD